MNRSLLRFLSLRRFALIGGTSASAIGIVIASPAAAQCVPNPTVVNGMTTCIDIPPRATITGDTTTLTGAIANAGTLVFNQATDGVFTGMLTGTGVLVKNGEGVLTISRNQGFVGATMINAGQLRLLGGFFGPFPAFVNFPSAVTVGGSGTLGGYGTVARLDVTSGGTVGRAGNDIIYVTGNYNAAAGSTYLAFTYGLTFKTTNSSILVGGSATLVNGALLVVTRNSQTYQIGQRYTLLTANGGITGSYTLVQSPTGGTEFRLVQTANSISVDTVRTGASLMTLARTSNQAAVAGSFGTLGSANAAYAILTLNPDDAAVPPALTSLSGEVHASLRTGMLRDAQTGGDAVRSRMLSHPNGHAVWGQVNGLFGTDAATRDAAVVDRRGWGIFSGIDTAIGTHARAGIAGGYTRTSFDIDARASHGTIKTKHVLGYAGGTLGPVALRASVGYAWSDDKTTRTVTFTDYTATHRAAYRGETLHGMFEAGITRPLLNGKVEPYVGIEAYRVHSNSFAETGTTATALVGRATSETLTLSNLGLRADTPFVNGLSARTHLGWRHVIGDARPNATLQFAGASLPFTVTGAGLSRDSALLALDLEWKPVKQISIVAGYSGAIGSNGADDSRLRLTASLGF